MFKPLFKSDTDVCPLCQVILIWGLFWGKAEGEVEAGPCWGVGRDGSPKPLSSWYSGSVLVDACCELPLTPCEPCLLKASPLSEPLLTLLVPFPKNTSGWGPE